MDKPPFPAYLDNTAISDYKRCPTLWQYGSLHKLTRPGKSVHLHAGACFATGLEATRRGFHEYGLTEDEFAHVLRQFPIVPEPVKTDALNAYRAVQRGLVK